MWWNFNKSPFIRYLNNYCKYIEEISISLSDKDLTMAELLVELISKQIYLQKFIFKYNTLNSLFIVNSLIAVNKRLIHVEFTRCQFKKENALYKFSCYRNLKIILNDCKIFHKSYDVIDEILLMTILIIFRRHLPLLISISIKIKKLIL